MRISVFGMGYVGSVAAACLARDGHHVLAVDPDPDKRAALERGEAPVVEPGLSALIAEAVRAGRLVVAASVDRAVAETEVSLVCVGTPSRLEAEGETEGSDRPCGDGLDLGAVEGVAGAIGAALRRKTRRHTVVVRSTLPLGVMTGRVTPLIEQASGLRAGEGFGLAYYPELFREGSALADYDHPSFALLAASDPATEKCVKALQPRLAIELQRVGFAEAEAIKVVSNAWRAMKVAFANEAGAVLAAWGLDSHTVLGAMSADSGLNLSPAYLTPGFAFGGSCLPKDLRAFIGLAAATGQAAPLLKGALAANAAAIERAAARVRAAGGRRVSVIGLAFKPGTDDLRESPYVILAERLIADGCAVRLFDPLVAVQRLTGANRAYALAHLPDLAERLCDSLQVALDHAETLVLAHAGPGAAALDAARPEQAVVDLVRVRPALKTGGRYQGLSW